MQCDNDVVYLFGSFCTSSNRITLKKQIGFSQISYIFEVRFPIENICTKKQIFMYVYIYTINPMVSSLIKN